MTRWDNVVHLGGPVGAGGESKIRKYVWDFSYENFLPSFADIGSTRNSLRDKYIKTRTTRRKIRRKTPEMTKCLAPKPLPSDLKSSAVPLDYNQVICGPVFTQ